MLPVDKLPALRKPFWRFPKNGERCSVDPDEFRFDLADSELGIGREACCLGDCCLPVDKLQVNIQSTRRGVRSVRFKGNLRQVVRGVLMH